MQAEIERCIAAGESSGPPIGTAEQSAVAGFRHPFCARQVALESPPGAIGFRITMQHYSCDVTPVGTLRVRVEQAQIGDNVLLVINGQNGIGGGVPR